MLCEKQAQRVHTVNTLFTLCAASFYVCVMPNCCAHTLMDYADGKPNMTGVALIQRVWTSEVTLTLTHPRNLNSLCIFSCFPLRKTPRKTLAAI